MQTITGSYTYTSVGGRGSWYASSNNPPIGRSTYTNGTTQGDSEARVKQYLIDSFAYFEYKPEDTIYLNGIIWQESSLTIAQRQQQVVLDAASKAAAQAEIDASIAAQIQAKVNYLSSSTAQWGSNTAYTGELNETNAEISAYNSTLVSTSKSTSSSSLPTSTLSGIQLNTKMIITVLIIVILLWLVLKK